MITKTTLQAIKALVELAKLPADQSEGIARIAQRIHAPQNYLGKVFQSLVWEGIVVSQKGLNGGFRLAKDPSKISLYDVADNLEDIGRWEGCFMGKAKCSAQTACAVHSRWELARKTYMEFLKSTTIADLKEK